MPETPPPGDTNATRDFDAIAHLSIWGLLSRSLRPYVEGSAAESTWRWSSCRQISKKEPSRPTIQLNLRLLKVERLIRGNCVYPPPYLSQPFEYHPSKQRSRGKDSPFAPAPELHTLFIAIPHEHRELKLYRELFDQGFHLLK